MMLAAKKLRIIAPGPCPVLMILRLKVHAPMKLLRNFVIFFLVLLSQVISRLVCGSIPVNGGAGWDGNGYLRLISILANGGSIAGDPYHTIRLPGVAFGLALGYASFSPSGILLGQAIFNMVLMAWGAVLLYSSMIKLGSTSRNAAVSIAIYALAWPVLVIPSYYPLLTDHAAIFFGCLAIWCWAYQKDLLLWVLIPVGFWVMPGVFLIPVALIAFRSQGSFSLPSDHSFMRNIFWGKVFLTVLAVYFVGRLGLAFLNDIPGQLIADHSRYPNGVTALLELRRLSTAMMAVQFAFLVWLVVDRLVFGDVWYALRWKQAIAGLFAAGIGAYIISATINWSTGYTGPPLADYMSYQSLALPAKPLVAHFVGLSPVVLLVIWGLLQKSASPAQTGLSAAVIAFMPFLMFGSESRQWVVVLPVLVAAFALQAWGWLQRLVTVAAAVLISLPMFTLKKHVDRAFSEGVALQSHDWQYYFSRQGPWMSVESYETAVCLIVVFLLLVAAVGAQRLIHVPARGAASVPQV